MKSSRENCALHKNRWTKACAAINQLARNGGHIGGERGASEQQVPTFGRVQMQTDKICGEPGPEMIFTLPNKLIYEKLLILLAMPAGGGSEGRGVLFAARPMALGHL